MSVSSVRSKYPTPLGARHAEFLLEVARDLHMNLLKKSAGSVVTLPDGTNVSQDIVVDAQGNGYDILGDAEGSATPKEPSGAVPGSPFPPSQWYVVQASPVPVPVPDPTPVPTPTPTPDLDVSGIIQTLVDEGEKIRASVDGLKNSIDFLNKNGIKVHF